MKQFTTGEFAKLAGVTIRTLRYYDKQGLLTPSHHTEAGFRLYSESDFPKLQQILTLKFIGLSLTEIKQLLTSDTYEIEKLLVKQKLIMNEKIAQSQTILSAIQEAQKTITKTKRLNWEQFASIIKAVSMSNNTHWINAFFTQEQLERLAKKQSTFTEQKEVGLVWKKLYEDIRANMDKSPESEEAQTLLDRWQRLAHQFVNGDEDLIEGLRRVYQNIDQVQASERQMYDENKDVFQFITKAVAARKK